MTKKTWVTLELPIEVIDEMKGYYKGSIESQDTNNVFRARVDGCVITAYKTGKVLFQGNNAELESSRWGLEKPKVEKPKVGRKKYVVPYTREKDISELTLIGSDEAGTGSYFGAVTVCCVYLVPSDFELMENLGVKDSKNLDDSKIRRIAPKIKEAVPYHLSVCNPDYYNSLVKSKSNPEFNPKKHYTTDSFKVREHNIAINNLVSKLTKEQLAALDGILIDDFASKGYYLKNLRREQPPLYNTKDLIFEKKAESLHLSVAAASIIARDAFLQSLEDLAKPYNFDPFPSGASAAVDQEASKLYKQYGDEALRQTAKYDFANTKKAKKLAGN